MVTALYSYGTVSLYWPNPKALLQVCFLLDELRMLINSCPVRNEQLWGSKGCDAEPSSTSNPKGTFSSDEHWLPKCGVILPGSATVFLGNLQFCTLMLYGITSKRAGF